MQRVLDRSRVAFIVAAWLFSREKEVVKRNENSQVRCPSNESLKVRKEE
jgi:hypothetical protein